VAPVLPARAARRPADRDEHVTGGADERPVLGAETDAGGGEAEPSRQAGAGLSRLLVGGLPLRLLAAFAQLYLAGAVLGRLGFARDLAVAVRPFELGDPALGGLTER
jgi:hypothetical protein